MTSTKSWRDITLKKLWDTACTWLTGNFLLELADEAADRIKTNKEKRVRNTVMSNNILGLEPVGCPYLEYVPV